MKRLRKRLELGRESIRVLQTSDLRLGGGILTSLVLCPSIRTDCTIAAQGDGGCCNDPVGG